MSANEYIVINGKRYAAIVPVSYKADNTPNLDSAGAPAVNTTISSPPSTATPYVLSIAVASLPGWAATEAFEVDLTGKQITKYRFKPSGTALAVRCAEDAINRTQAESWLQVGQALAAGEINCRPPVLKDTWSEWRYFPESYFLTNLWFLPDTDVSATVILECE